MKTLLFLIALLANNLNAQQPSEATLIKSAVKKYYLDMAFKSNLKFKLLEISDLKYELVGENSLDSAKLSKIEDKQQYYFKMANSHIEVARIYGKQVVLYDYPGSESLKQIAKMDFDSEIRKANLYTDSLAQTVALDSSIRRRIETRLLRKPKYFKVNYHLKATIAGQNTLDRFTLFLTKDDYKVVKLD